MSEEELALVVDESASEVIVIDMPEPVAVTVVDHRPFLSTPLDDYTVSEGLLLLIVVILFLNLLGRALKEGFSWLLP